MQVVLTREHCIDIVLLIFVLFFFYRSLYLHHQNSHLKERIKELVRLLDRRKPTG